MIIDFSIRDSQYEHYRWPKGCRGVFVDVGAYDGNTYHSTIRNNPDSGSIEKIILIEPLPELRVPLNNIAQNDKRVTVVMGACFNVDGTRTLHLSTWSNGANTLIYPELGKAPEGAMHTEHGPTVEVFKLDTLLSRLGIEALDLLKVDTEGAEYEVLQGFSKYKSGTQFHIEYHYDNLSRILTWLDQKGVKNVIVHVWTWPSHGFRFGSIMGEFP